MKNAFLENKSITYYGRMIKIAEWICFFNVIFSQKLKIVELVSYNKAQIENLLELEMYTVLYTNTNTTNLFPQITIPFKIHILKATIIRRAHNRINITFITSIQTLLRLCSVNILFCIQLKKFLFLGSQHRKRNILVGKSKIFTNTFLVSWHDFLWRVSISRQFLTFYSYVCPSTYMQKIQRIEPNEANPSLQHIVYMKYTLNFKAWELEVL
jgi:hypothetical protein